MSTVSRGYSFHLRGLLLALIATGAVFVGTATAQAAPAWRVESIASTTVAQGEVIKYQVQMRNVGDSTLDGSVAPITFRATFPSGIKTLFAFGLAGGWDCNGVIPGEQEFTCENSSDSFVPHELTPMIVLAEVDVGASGTLTSQFEVAGGDPANPSDVTFDPTRISATAPPFGIDAFDGHLDDGKGAQLTQAGGHPDEFTTSIDFNTVTNPIPIKGIAWPVEPVKDLVVDLPPGFLANPGSVVSCTLVELGNAERFSAKPLCPPASQVGTNLIYLNYNEVGAAIDAVPVFNMVPPVGHPARLGFSVAGTLVLIDAELRQSDYGVTARLRNISEGLGISGAVLTLWGNPADEKHRLERSCPGQFAPWEEPGSPTCPANAAPSAFLRMPTACTSPGEALPWSLAADSWFDPGAVDGDGNPDLTDSAWSQASFESHEAPGLPLPPDGWGPPRGVDGCELVPVAGDLEAEPTTRDAESSSGLQVHFEVPNPGLENPEASTSTSDIRKVQVALPKGMTINPSQAEGLGVCTPAQYESTELSFFPTPGKGCPDDSKIGTVEVVTPLLEEKIPGDVYVAQQDDPATSTPGAENPFDSLLAIYVVLEEPERGILIKLPGKVDLEDPAHPGQIVTTFDDLPQQPFDTFDFKFREGARAPLVTPPTCGTYTTEARIWGHSDPDGPPIVSDSDFAIDRGIGAGPCPSGGTPGFDPGFSAGSLNNNAGSYSPVMMRLTRKDGEQNLTKFSALLPPGLSAKIAGVEKCPEAGIAAAKGKTGRAELASPSCPAGSKIGRTTAGAGVGSVLTQVPGSLYLAGPYNGAPLSVVSVTPAVAGPFDVGTVVVRVALRLDPVTAKVAVDGSASDPIPHILRGIPLKLRDLRVHVDRDRFTVNPTSCDPMAIGASLWGSAADVFSSADDTPVARSARYQAASCASLGFAPRLRINLTGGTKRSKFPALRAELNARPGDANIGRVRVALPRSEFLAQAHIGTSCTRVQFAAAGGNGRGCPENSVYGFARAWTPLLDEPLEGPVFLRSNGGERELPDLVAALRGIVDIELEGWIDSKKGGGIRTTFQSVPDAPVTKFVLSMKGGKKGLLENSTNICRGKHRATVEMDGQNGKLRDFRPLLRAKCGKSGKAKRRR